MRTFKISIALLALSAFSWMLGQQVQGTIEKNPGKPHVAVTDFRANGAAAAFIGDFNATVRADLEGSPLINFVPKTLYPLQVPQQPSDLTAGVAPPNRGRAVNMVANRLTDW